MSRFISRWMIIITIVQITACAVLQKPNNESTPEKLVPEIVFHNGTILTMEDIQPLAQAILIQGDAITAVGSDAEVFALRSARTDNSARLH